MRFRPRLRTLLLCLSLTVLLLPLGGIAILRLYESELVKQTESELISQAALTAAMFRATYLQQFEQTRKNNVEIDPAGLGNPLVKNWLAENADGLTPLPPQLDLARIWIRPRAPAAAAVEQEPEAVAQEAGRALIPVIAGATKTILSAIRIVDHKGIVVASSSGDLGLSLMAMEEVERALTGEPVSLLRVRHPDSPLPTLDSISRRTRHRVFVALPVVLENRVVGAVIASRTPLDVAKALYLIRAHLLKAGFILLCVVLLMSLLATHFINRPVKGLIAQVKRAQMGGPDDHKPLENPVIQEVAELSEAIAQMSKTLAERAEYIKTFAANISHEFKTPLTSLRGAVEILRDHYEDMSPSERENFLVILQDETRRLETMVKQLLDLARAEVFKPEGEMTALQPVLEEMAARYQDKKLAVKIMNEYNDGRVAMGREIFASIISNLLDNTLLHGGEGCRVVISISAVAAGDRPQVVLVIADDGKGISPANAERIFRPFFTTARDRGGSGLGLAIVKSLVEAHYGTIELLPSTTGAVFKIVLPC